MDLSKHDLYYGESRSLSRSRGKLACFFGISLVPIFVGLDFVLVPQVAPTFAALRGINTVQNVLIFLVLQYAKSLSLRQLNLLVTFYFCSIGIMIAYMCFLMGGFGSTYYAGLNIVMLVVGVVMAWHPVYTLLCGMIMYVGYVMICLQGKVVFGDLVNSSYFLLSTTFICVIGTVWKEKQRLTEFLLRQQLKSLAQTKSNFLATISHELKTPMTLIVNPIEQAFAAGKGGKVELDERQAEVVRKNTYRLATLVGDLIEISRGEVGKKQLVPSDVADTKTYIAELVHSMKPLFDEKGVALTLTLDTALAGHYLDVKKIDKVIYNLLSNALKFTPQGGSVTVRVSDESMGAGAAALVIEVSDTGIGVPQEKQERIFERFSQVEEGASRSYEGMGIGLSLVKDFVEQHGGTVVLDSAPGRGSTFTVTLPRGREHFTVPVVTSDASRPISEQKLDFTRALIRDEAKRKTEPVQMPEADSGKWMGKPILVVDDNDDIRETVRQALRSDYDVVMAVNGKEGLAKAREIRPELIVSDIMMPEMDGYEMTRQIRKDPVLKETPVLLLTAKSGEEGLEAGFEAGATDYLTKPFSPTELKLRVRNHLLLQEMKAEVVRHQNLVSIGTLAAGVAHNINNLMGAAGAALGCLELEIDESKASLGEAVQPFQKRASSLRNVVNGTIDIVDGLMKFSQVNHARFSERNIHEGLDQAAAMVKLVEDRPVTIEKDYRAGSPVLLCSLQDLHAAFLNILKNAVESFDGRSDGRISIRTADAAEGVRILIEDNGRGMTPEVQARIFEPFFTTKDVGQRGAGLGLWTVYRTVAAHDGRISVRSVPGQGTAFEIHLPMINSLQREGAVHESIQANFGSGR